MFSLNIIIWEAKQLKKLEKNLIGLWHICSIEYISRKPSDVTTPEMIIKTLYLECDDRKLKIRKIYTLEIRKQSKKCVKADRSAPKRPKTQQLTGKVMSTVF